MDSIQLRRAKRRMPTGSSGSDRPRAQLTIPSVPKFPLSSPITDEITSPAGTSEGSSEEDRDLELNQPFEFLSKVTSRNPFVSNAGRAAPDRIRDFERRFATHAQIHNPERERPVGLNLEIPGSVPQPELQQPLRKETAGAFVDLNDLKVLSQAREEERTAQKIKGILKKGDDKKERGSTKGFQRLADDSSDSRGGKRLSLLDAVSKVSKRKTRDDGISPTDRPIVIGFSVPYDSPELQDGKDKEVDSAGTQHTPLTPSIIVTPAREDGFWGHLSPENMIHARPRAASSVYSQPSPRLGHNHNVPPVPALPAFYSTGNDSSATARVLGSVRKRRSMSTGAVSEKGEELPAGRPRSQSNEKVSRISDRLTINTSLNARASQGWWNYLLSPLLSASSLLSPKTPTTTKTRPHLPTISTSSSGLTDEWWDEKEKEKEREVERSYFSPDTPEATRRISSWQSMTGNPFADFDWSIDEKQPQSQDQLENQSPEAQDRGAASMMFSGQRIQGSAAEYYQACAHELFSGTPYFECVNHICSITPKDKIPVAVDGTPLQDQDTQGARGLLIDVDDMPRSNHLESPGSGITSINSSPSDGAGRLSVELRGSLKSSREPPGEGTSGTPKVNSPTLDTHGGTRQSGSSAPINPFEQPREPSVPPAPSNPFLEQPREPSPSPPQPPTQAPAPATIHIESAAPPPPANIHIEAPSAQPAPNIHYGAPAPPAPVIFETPAPHGTSRAPNPFEYAPGPSMVALAPEPVPRHRSVSRTGPPPIAMPSPEQVPPPVYGAQAQSPYPRSPESLQESTERGAVRLSNMLMPSGPAPAYTPHDNSALPPRAIPITRDILTHPVSERDRVETRRRRYEREDAISRRAGGLWRGRGPFSNKGCFGRRGREGRLRRRWYAAICLFFLAIVVGAILLATFLTRKGDGTPVQSAWLNLTGYPPMPTGISTIAGPENTVQDSGCITPNSMWSCALPKEQQDANEPYATNQPNFRVEIRFQNGTYDHSTTLASRSIHRRSAYQLFNPNPDPPSVEEQAFLGQYTDKTSSPYAGEETPFYITVLSAEYLSSSSSSQYSKRDNDTSTTNNTSTFPDVTSLIPSPSKASDGTAAPATLYPLPSSQPVRLYNRGKKDEHYGFYTYFDRSIFLSSSAALTGIKENNNNDTDGGSTKEDASVRCTWAQTRFLVQIWTKGDELGRSVFARSVNSTTSTSANSTSSSPSTAVSSATDFTRPGSFPYPISITLDRHGGNVEKKNLYCYGLEENARYNASAVKLQLEDRSANSTNDEAYQNKDYGGYDGGMGGCLYIHDAFNGPVFPVSACTKRSPGFNAKDR
ncbi:hypothetical protein AN7552.2 [Aspergillus nidulans FGSC A4]|uniref:HLH transcription factor (Hpa3), putative (AFU_orthologue AFUA_2G14800) n=1 Tax=Emericella nidulans (strain FGSC A4 / ATCC 38163 / CBS 112.46 / NRRL 194 / M139) TaxID=227321 RepID=Q5AVX8_EMENI|nr:hypothetical protein [Aspergillus nidulans FGSC A4]EAA62132.1 hypothetical protein AN7552.2 [Aspergillus nidulans FGSC A4]CBF79617.1 TPA: HLH transcription factor (Hpa3), putative (AFU_orthologue; AFUA_2G14800) [Aspergillus nidulans FGSC A4]|eukprot:XP_680821.1 hypothetical protein AN7552.2 [Aspergillus nidulans FGSC A4]